MEQYIHTLIAFDSEFSPVPAQVARFFGELSSRHQFEPITNEAGSVGGLAVAKPSGRVRWGADPMTGEKISVPQYDRVELPKSEAITGAIEGAEHYTVMQFGQWTGGDRPIDLSQADGKPYDGNYLCTVRCELRAEAVSTSTWDIESGPDLRHVPEFGSPCVGQTALGIFPNPWTGSVVEVDGAGCARFWIEFEFGRFLYPKITDNFEVLNHAFVGWAEQCFQVKLAQGCRF
jgi:hypothetical protein